MQEQLAAEAEASGGLRVVHMEPFTQRFTKSTRLISESSIRNAPLHLVTGAAGSGSRGPEGAISTGLYKQRLSDE